MADRHTDQIGPTSIPLHQRAGGPDLARGLALLGIAMANTIGWLHGTQWTVLLKQADATVTDRAVDAITALIIDNRGFPLFALLFGYGIGILHRRSRARGESSRVFLLRMLRRHLVLLLIGIVHGVLLFRGDILVPYAIIGTLCTVMITRRARWLLPLAVIIALPVLAPWGWADGTIGLGDSDGYADASAATYAAAVQIRAWDMLHTLWSAIINDLGLLAMMALGALAARIHLFERIGPNRALLRRLTLWGITAGLLGALPLTAVLVLDPHHQHIDGMITLGVLGLIHQYSGVLAAVGAAAAAALVADYVRRPAPGLAAGRPAPHPVRTRLLRGSVHGIEALGTTALSAYVLQSLIFLALFPPYTLDLGSRIGSAWSAVIVLTSWAMMVLLATWLRRAGRRGPLEVVLRRLAGSATVRPEARR